MARDGFIAISFPYKKNAMNLCPKCGLNRDAMNEMLAGGREARLFAVAFIQGGGCWVCSAYWRHIRWGPPVMVAQTTQEFLAKCN